jgi:hypothetical protein
VILNRLLLGVMEGLREGLEGSENSGTLIFEDGLEVESG